MASEDHNLLSIKEKLNEEKIKLWLPPFTTDDGNPGNYPQTLVTRYSTELGLNPEIITSLLEQLRLHALEKLSARNKYQKTGVATLKIKIVDGKNRQTAEKDVVNIESGLQMSGKFLKDQVAKLAGTRPSFIKLISGGRVVQEDKSLQEQNIKHQSRVMALVLSESELEAVRREEQASRLQRIRRDAELLSSIDDGDPDNDYYLQVADQSGRILKLPSSERKALALAMTLHEKGRGAMKRKDYGEALVFLLEADKEFQLCTADILKSVDNYALLSLDISWCYLCLRSVAELPGADSKLQSCENCFLRSYGPNLERLEAVKGSTGNESALFARLHLIQGIVAYHQNRVEQARSLLNRASNELTQLKVDDDKLSQVMALGYNTTEARIALRRCGSNIQMAVQHIIQRREDRLMIRQKELEEKKKRIEQKKLGKTVNGEWVNVDYYNMLLSMGYKKPSAKAALQQANNNIGFAVQVLQEQPYLLPNDNIDDEHLAQVASMGFSPVMARRALEKSRGNIGRAIEILFSCGGVIEEDCTTSSSSSSSSDSSPSSSIPTPNKSSKQKDEEKEAVNRLSEDIPDYEEDHLDLTLEEEEMYLKEYLALLESVSH